MTHLYHQPLFFGLKDRNQFFQGLRMAQKLAEDLWFAARGYKVMELPTGQGILVK